jgi:hypothetical protein
MSTSFGLAKSCNNKYYLWFFKLNNLSLRFRRPCFGVGFCLIAYSCCGAMFPCSLSTSRKAHGSSMTICFHARRRQLLMAEVRKR